EVCASTSVCTLDGIGTLLSQCRPARFVVWMLRGDGLMFLVLDLTVSAVDGLAESELFGLMLATAEAQPLTLLLVGVLLGALLSSTNGAAAVAIGLVAGDAVSLTAAFALIAGGNVGGTFLPLL